MVTARSATLFFILFSSISLHAADDDLSDLIHKCNDSDPAVRALAIENLGQLEEKTIEPKTADAVAAILGQFRDKDEKVREACNTTLTTLANRGGKGLEAILGSLQDIQLAPHANLFLSEFRKYPVAAIPMLIADLNANHWAVRSAAARALGRLNSAPDQKIDTKPIVTALIDALKDDNRQVRQSIAESLQTYSKEAVPALLSALKDGPAESHAGAAYGIAALHAAAPPQESVAAVRALLKDQKSETRAAGIFALGEFGSDAREALSDLEPLLRDDSQEMRIAAALAIEKISSALHDATLAVLFHALVNAAPVHRLDIVTALDRWNLELACATMKEAAPALITVLDDANPDVRRRAMQALIKVARGNKDAFAPLVDALKSTQPLVRSGVTTVFVQLGVDAKDAAAKLAEILQSDDLLLRDIAAQILLRVAPKAPEAPLASRLINEATIYRTCKAYVTAQTRYHDRETEGGDYAQSLRGNRSLYETKSGAGDLKFISKAMADAEGEPGKSAAVYASYRFKILKAQGAHALGGAKSYLEKNRMTLGHALVAYPARYDSGGRLTFLVSNEGTVYFKDLGTETAGIVAKMAEFNPDESWKSIKDAETDTEPIKF